MGIVVRRRGTVPVLVRVCGGGETAPFGLARGRTASSDEQLHHHPSPLANPAPNQENTHFCITGWTICGNTCYNFGSTSGIKAVASDNLRAVG
ncbi:hypothetical protein EJB05_07488, partial [Eragrostis curvula]